MRTRLRIASSDTGDIFDVVLLCIDSKCLSHRVPSSAQSILINPDRIVVTSGGTVGGTESGIACWILCCNRMVHSCANIPRTSSRQPTVCYALKTAVPRMHVGDMSYSQYLMPAMNEWQNVSGQCLPSKYVLSASQTDPRKILLAGLQ
jgi:hypothetical protein